MYNSVFLALLNSHFLLPDDDYFSLKYTLLSLIFKKNLLFWHCICGWLCFILFEAESSRLSLQYPGFCLLIKGMRYYAWLKFPNINY